MPRNITLLHLPPYLPELNGSERLWFFRRSQYLSNRLHKDYDKLFEVIELARNSLDADRFKTLTRSPWIERAA